MKTETLTEFLRVYVPAKRAARIQPLADALATLAGGATVANVTGYWQGESETIVTVTSYSSNVASLLQVALSHIASLLDDGEQAVAVETREGLTLYERD
jgi:hypothetical protein